MALQELQEVQRALQGALSNGSEKLSDLDSDVLLERHTTLKVERVAMLDTSPAQERAALTNRIKRIEAVLRERGVDFEPLPQANRPVALGEMSDEELLTEFERIQSAYPDATAGQKSSMTVRLKAMKLEVGNRIERATQGVEAAPDGDTTPAIESEGPTDEELAATAASEGDDKPAPRRSRRRSS